MAYTIPVFNLKCNIWRHGNATTNPPDVSLVECNLALGKRVVSGPDKDVVVGIDGVFRYILMPIGTDVRGQFHNGGSDTIECPAGTGRYYTCLDAEYSGGGFSNEHVFTMCISKDSLPDGFPALAS